MTDNIWLWIGFNAFVLVMLALDLGVFHRKAHVVTFKESIAWTVVWVTLALLFNLGVAHYMGDQKGLEFFTGYVIEKSLSVDNVFVFALLFSYFAAPTKIMIARMTSAPRMPQNKQRCWYFCSTLKNVKMSAMTKTLSIESDNSMM